MPSITISPMAATELRTLRAELTAENKGVRITISEVIIKVIKAYRASQASQ